MSAVKTPCIGVCSTGIGDSVCRGCKRFSHEVIAWNGYSNKEKQAVLSRIQLLLAQVVANKFVVFDSGRLLQQIQNQKIRINATANPYCWLFDLLKAGANQIHAMEEFGFRSRQNSENMSATQLRDAIDLEFFQLSCAHYERYFILGHNLSRPEQ
ncbi:hypothetical protein SAMN02745866_02638 [Alteromonadaceae bacterium Bs31]|nr:hypothetical protein SAMN02745866_02638 [Alteromonadaceae bacterium Bs31]